MKPLPVEAFAPRTPTPSRETLARLITWDYVCQQREMHLRPEGYGGKGKKWVDAVIQILVDLKATSVLDYGCGQGTLARALRAKQVPGLRIAEYDPAIPGKDGYPSFADLVTCTDVLEHIEPDRLDTVLQHLRLLARRAVFVVVSLRPSEKVLPDGRNAHLIVQPEAWWLEQFAAAGFEVRPGPRRNGKIAKEFTAILTPMADASVPRMFDRWHGGGVG